MALTDPDARGELAPTALDLRRVDADALAVARALATVLDGHDFDGQTLTARVGFAVANDGCWLTSADARLGIVALDGAAVALHPERVKAVVAALDRVEPLLSVIEAATGLLLEFTGTAAVEADTPLVELGFGAPSARSALLLVVTRADWRPPAAIAHRRAGTAIVPVSRIVRGVRLSIDEASGIEAGDMLVLPAGIWAMAFAAPHMAAWTGGFDPVTGRLSIGFDGQVSTGDTSVSAPTTDAATLGAFAVPVAISLPDASATIAELEGLAPGATLLLGPAVAGLDVQLRIADRVIASGELVRLGDDYAVLVTALPRSPAAEPDPGI